jgi:uncharacterized protein
VVNCDPRGAGTSDGVGDILSVQEGQDVYDVIEWATAQPWNTGAVGMIGVSYLAISQFEGTAQRPPHLRAIVPWEGMTDPYRDLLRPGGIRETGFVKLWSAGLKSDRLTYSLGDRNAEHPVRDDYWQSVAADLSKIDVPALTCASFSDNNLHSRGSFRAFQQIASTDKHVYTHRSGKWATFYSEEARGTQLAFLDRHLRGTDAVNCHQCASKSEKAATSSQECETNRPGPSRRNPPLSAARSRSTPARVEHDSAGPSRHGPSSPGR